MRVLLDTSAYAAWKRGDAGTVAVVRGAERVYMSAVVAGELMFGFRHGSHEARNLKELDAFLKNPYVSFLPVTLTTARRFGMLASALRKKGTPIPTNDIWIAAHALETGADLVSFDRHFLEIDGLARIHPGEPAA
jgi:tRNA(fMet)-specific endonuclease VapC